MENLKEFYCSNNRCRAVLCRTDGTTIFFQLNGFDVEVSLPKFPFPCPMCGRITFWHRKKVENSS